MANNLKPLVFIPNRDYDEKTEIYTMEFPGSWHKCLSEVYSKVIGRTNKPVKPPVNSLCSVITALFPEIINAQFRYMTPWLTSGREIERDLIINVIKAWVNYEFLDRASSDEVKKEVNRIMDILDEGELNWSKVNVNLYQANSWGNGTINPEQGYFDALPDYICNKIYNTNKGLKLKGETLYFIRCGKDELMSWPPKSLIDYKDDSWYYSIVIKFSVETIPFYKEPVILMKVITRRFVTNPLIDEEGFIKLSKDYKTTVYLSTKTYWYDKKQRSGFSKAMIKYSYNKQYGSRVEWDDNISRIMNSLNLNTRLPEAMELIKEPHKFLSNSGDVIAAIGFTNFLKDKHEGGTGTSMGDMKELYDQIAVLLPELKKFDDNERVKLRLVSNNLLDKKDSIEGNIKRESLAKTVGDRINFEIRYQTEEVRNAVEKNIKGILELDQYDEEQGVYRTPEISIGISSIPLETIGHDLDEKGAIERINHIENEIPFSDIPTGAIIELEGKESKKWKNGDPKFAIRDGMAKTGRLTQFITPKNQNNPKDKVELRAKNAVWDLLRQFEYMPTPPKIEIFKGGLKDDFGMLAIHIIRTKSNGSKKGKNFPVAVYMHTDSHDIKVKCPVFNNKWYSYRKAQLELCKYTNDGNNNFYMKDDEIAEFIHRLLLEIGQAGPSVVLVDSQNIRSCWKWVSDKNIDKENVYIGDKTNTINFKNYPEMRIVRVRSGEETPVYYGEGSNGIGTVSGLFELTNNVYWGIASKPNTFTGPSFGHPASSRIEKPDKEFKYPGIVEIVPLCLQLEDDASEWAYAVYRMREMLSYYDEFVSLPAPLHLASKLEEYVNEVEG